MRKGVMMMVAMAMVVISELMATPALAEENSAETLGRCGSITSSSTQNFSLPVDMVEILFGWQNPLYRLMKGIPFGAGQSLSFGTDIWEIGSWRNGSLPALEQPFIPFSNPNDPPCVPSLPVPEPEYECPLCPAGGGPGATVCPQSPDGDINGCKCLTAFYVKYISQTPFTTLVDCGCYETNSTTGCRYCECQIDKTHTTYSASQGIAHVCAVSVTHHWLEEDEQVPSYVTHHKHDCGLLSTYDYWRRVELCDYTGPPPGIPDADCAYCCPIGEQDDCTTGTLTSFYVSYIQPCKVCM